MKLKTTVIVILTSLCFSCALAYKINKNRNADKYNENCKTIFNNTCNILDGETVYPEQIKAIINKYNNKYKINIQYAENQNDFFKILSNIDISSKPQAIFQYNQKHKYGFIFVKHNNEDYCICIDTIPSLSEYTKNLYFKNNNLYIDFNKKKYRVIMFGENLQKAQQGCGYFTLAMLKQLLKNNAEYLFEVLEIEEKFGTKDKTKRDDEKKSVIRGVDFKDIKHASFAPDIYKYAQSMSLQQEFDDRKLKNGKISFNAYRLFYSTSITKNDKQTIISTKIFKIAQSYKDNVNKNNNNITKHKNVLFTIPNNIECMEQIKTLKTYNIAFAGNE